LLLLLLLLPLLLLLLLVVGHVSHVQLRGHSLVTDRRMHSPQWLLGGRMWGRQHGGETRLTLLLDHYEILLSKV